jgi:hypothetical protein
LKKKHPPNWADLFIAKIDTNYNFSNILHFSPVHEAFLNDLKVDSNKSVYVALNNKGELYFRDSCILGKGNAFSEISSAIIKVKKDGAHEFFKSFEYFNSRDNDIFFQDGIKSMDFDDNGNVYVIAALGNNININANKNKDIYTKVVKESDFFLIKYDNSGNLIWYRQIKHNRRNMSLPKLKIHQNKIFLSIQYNDSINIDKDKWHFSRNYTIDPFSSCILVYDVNNNYVSSINIKSQESLFIGGFDINQNRLVTYGEFIGKADFDPTRATFEVSSTDFTRNGFIAMYDISKLDKNTIEYDTFPKNSSVKLDEETNFFAYPNPFTDELKIDLETFEKDIILDIFDLQSRKVLSQRFQNKKSITLKTDEVSKGSYILKLKTKTYEKDYKVQKE